VEGFFTPAWRLTWQFDGDEASEVVSSKRRPVHAGSNAKNIAALATFRIISLFSVSRLFDPLVETKRHVSGEEEMRNFVKKVQRFLKSEDGPTAVEYAVMLALIIIVCLTAITAVGTQASAQFNNIATQVGGAGS
jgi:pilus assembly protein Flp/PilA